MKRLIPFALLFVTLACTRHRAPDPRDVYRDVPETDRESLRAAVSQLVEFQTGADWEKMYEVAPEPKEDKDRFSRRRSAVRGLRAFTPMSATWVPDGWVVAGCAVYSPAPKQPDALVSSLHATPDPAKKGKWLLTPVAVEIIPGEPGNIKPCSQVPASTAP